MIGALIGLYKIGVLFTAQPHRYCSSANGSRIDGLARVTFGRRSFHAAANPTAGGLVTTGPYRIIRHPIYTAACLFGWGADRCAQLFGKRRAGNTVATGCVHANDM